MTKINQKSVHNTEKSHLFGKIVLIWTIFLFILLLCGCAKTASETAADAALHQVDAVEQQIKKECPTAKIDKDMDALRSSIKSQLATCESELARVEADKVKWEVAFFATLIIMAAWFARKII